MFTLPEDVVDNITPQIKSVIITPGRVRIKGGVLQQEFKTTTKYKSDKPDVETLEWKDVHVEPGD